MPDLVRDLVANPWLWLLVVMVLFGLAYFIQKISIPPQAKV